MPDGGTMENPQLELADRFIGETAVNLFLTGRAGTCLLYTSDAADE